MKILSIDHLEFFVGDAKHVLDVFIRVLHMTMVAFSNQITGNYSYYSYVLQSGKVKFVITTPQFGIKLNPHNNPPDPSFNSELAYKWLNNHGSGVYAIAVHVENTHDSYNEAIANGAISFKPPYSITDSKNTVTIAEVKLYGDVVMRFVSYSDNYDCRYYPKYKPTQIDQSFDATLFTTVDHVVGNVPNMNDVIKYIKQFTGFNTFAKFSKEDIQTQWTSLNSEVLSNDTHNVLLPVNEPVHKEKLSQIQEFLTYNQGEGVQHIALKTFDIITTVNSINLANSKVISFLNVPPTYYETHHVRTILAKLPQELAKNIVIHNILVDEDDEGILLQIFTKPIFDRPTIFFEFIQRVCKSDKEIPGCGGFGKGNFKALFEAIEMIQQRRGNLY